MQVAIVEFEIDPHMPPHIIEKLGSFNIEKLKHMLPNDAYVRDTKMDVLDYPDRLARRVRMQVLYEVGVRTVQNPYYSVKTPPQPPYLGGNFGV